MHQLLDRIEPSAESAPSDDHELPRSDAEVASDLARCYHMRAQWDLALMRFVAEADQRKIYESQGLSSTAEWLSTYLGIGYMSAGKLFEVAVSLEQLPKMTEAYREGRISYDHLRALVQVAGPETEEELLSAVEGMSVADTFRMVSKILEVSAEDSCMNRRARWLAMRWDHQNRNLLLFGQLPEDQGAKVERAIDAIAKKMPEDPLCDLPPTPMGIRRADALCALADSYLSQDTSRPQLVVHVDADSLSTDSGVGEIENGPTISIETVRRLSCDALLRLVVHGSEGKPIGVGRAKRTVPGKVLTELKHRDGRCRVPGCRRRKGLHAHHIVPWAEGGETDYGNLVLLCETHHYMVHEGDYEIRGSPPKIWVEHPTLPPMKVGPPPISRDMVAVFDMEFAVAMAAAARGP